MFPASRTHDAAPTEAIRPTCAACLSSPCWRTSMVTERPTAMPTMATTQFRRVGVHKACAPAVRVGLLWPVGTPATLAAMGKRAVVGLASQLLSGPCESCAPAGSPEAFSPGPAASEWVSSLRTAPSEAAIAARDPGTGEFSRSLLLRHWTLCAKMAEILPASAMLAWRWLDSSGLRTQACAMGGVSPRRFSCHPKGVLRAGAG